MSGNRFPKPATPSRGDGNAFIKGFDTETPEVPLATEPDLPIVLGTPEPALVDAPAPLVRRRRAKELKIPMTYKHRETHYKRLKRISQALEIPMGELLDEALEAKFAEWEIEAKSVIRS